VKLLVIDDHPLMAEALAFALNGLEPSPAVQTALDLESALRLLEAAPADLVLVDLGLPGCSGMEALERFRNLILSAVRLVASGGIQEAPLSATARSPGITTSEQLGLSPRQAEVLTLLLKGLPNKLIARKLDISENTAKVHVSAVLKALGVASRVQALIAASRLGLRLRQ
jgi:DNA-binding NarL/FixJ family response regulator